MKSTRAVVGAVLLIMIGAQAKAATPDQIRTAIMSKFTLTQRSMMTGKVTKPGTIAIIQKAGINADPQSKLAMRAVVIKNGEIDHAGGGNLLGGDSGLTLKPGQQIYLYQIGVEEDSVTLLYGTVDSVDLMVNGSTRREYYKGALKFKYDGGLAAVQPSQVLADIGTWIKTESDAAASTANTIALGQTPEQVVAILGAPENKVDLGAEKIFIYKEMKIVFVDGKVSDVQ